MLMRTASTAKLLVGQDHWPCHRKQGLKNKSRRQPCYPRAGARLGRRFRAELAAQWAPGRPCLAGQLSVLGGCPLCAPGSRAQAGVGGIGYALWDAAALGKATN